MSTATTTAADAPPASLGIEALHAMRATRTRHRLGETEWFDTAYRVYIVALFGGGVLLWLSDVVGDTPLTPSRAADALAAAPAALGLVAVVAFAAGLRGGSQGGPLALEAADVVHVMLAPVDRRRALVRPAVQRVRSAAFAGAAVGGVLGQLAGRRLPGSALAWFGSGALFGADVALLWVGAALVAHGWHLRMRTSTTIGVVATAWQVAALAWDVPGPADVHGSLGVWGARQRAVDVVALVLTAALLVIGGRLLARTSLEALVRRTSLVAQLRFAVTMQDLRTVVLLRRQLSLERTRTRPWIRLRPGGRGAVWRRGWRSLLRLPTGRLLRMVGLVSAAAGCQVAAFHGTTPAVVGTLVFTFVLGLEVMEPLSQEVDQPDHTDRYPVERGHLLSRHLAAPAVALVPFAVLGAAVATAIHLAAAGTPRPGVGATAAVAAVLAVPTVAAGACAAVVNIVRDAPDPLTSASQQVFVPPEVAGATTIVRTLIPLLVSGLGALSAVVAREALAAPGAGVDDVLASGARMAVGAVLLSAGTAVWVRRRDRMRRAVRRFMEEGRAVTRQQRAGASTGARP